MNPVSIFYSYAHKDEEFREKLVTHLAALRREGLISEWHDRKLRGGDDWAGEIDDELNRALVILLLISPDFIDSEYCVEKELKRAMEHHEAGEARVIPVIVRDFDREINPEVFPFMKLQFLPSDGKPIKQWDNENAAFVNVAKGIRAVVKPLADARRQADEVRRVMDKRERGWDASGQAKVEADLTKSREALRESIEAAKEAGIGSEDSLTMAKGTLALAEDDYSAAREVFSEEEVESAENMALGAVRDADQAIQEAITKLLIRADADYGLEDWERALVHYEKVLALLERHSTGGPATVDRQVVGGRIAGCHFHLFVVNSSAGGALSLKNKARTIQHFGAFRKTVKNFLGPVRREPEVRFGWGGALRKDGAPRSWLKGIYLPGKRTDVQRMDDGEENGPYVSLWSEESSFVLGTTAHVDLVTHPFLSWRWMAIELPEKGDIRDSKRIDEALSLAVTFVDESGAWQQFYYGWDTAAPMGTIIKGGLFSLKWKLKVITSGAVSLGEWVECGVNLREDIREVYGENVVPKTAVMLMVQSNTQYTKGSGAGCIGEICFSTTKSPPHAV